MLGTDEGENVPNAIVARSGTGKPVRLYKNRQQLIEANLAGVKATAMKKQIAQQYFYNDADGPLKLENLSLGNRIPVHRRLGKRVILHLNNGSQYVRRSNQFGFRGMRRAPYNYTQQGRLIRPHQEGAVTRLFTSHYMQSIPPKVLMRQNNRWLERSAATQILQAAGGKGAQNPLNYTIEIPNNNTVSGAPNSYFPPTFRHSIRAQLSQNLQEQIRSVQAECVSVSLEPISMIPTLPGGATKISMNDRFNSLG